MAKFFPGVTPQARTKTTMAAVSPVAGQRRSASARPLSGKGSYHLRTRQFAFALALAMLGVVLGTVYGAWAASSLESRRGSLFESDSTRVVDFLNRTMDENTFATGIMHRYTGNPNNNVTRQGFDSFAEEIALRGIDLQAIEFVPRVSRDQRVAYEAEARAHWEKYSEENNIEVGYLGFKQFKLNDDGSLTATPRPDADVYYAVNYIWPVEGNAAVIGFDMLSWAVESDTIEHATAQGAGLSLTRRLRYLGDPPFASYSVLIVTSGDTVEQGLVVAVLRIDDLLARAFRKENLGRGLSIMLFEDTSEVLQGTPTSADFLGGSFSDANGTIQALRDVEYETTIAESSNSLSRTTYLEYGNRRWILVILSSNLYETPAYAALVIGAVVVGALGLLLAGIYLFEEGNHLKAQLAIERGAADARAERAVNSFLAHEVRNPLSVALSAIEFTRSAVCRGVWDDSRSKDAALKDTNLVFASLSFIHELLDNMLDVRKIEDGQMVLNLQTTSIVNDVLIPVRNMLDQNDSELQILVDSDDDPLFAVADSLRLKQIVMNLAKNAVKFTPNGSVTLSARRKTNTQSCKCGDMSSLCISPPPPPQAASSTSSSSASSPMCSCSSENSGVVIKVCDTGPGVPTATRGVLFQRYGSLDHVFQGTGLGLYLCSSMVQRMHGKIYLDETYRSPQEGCPGSCFVVELPLEVLPPPAGVGVSGTSRSCPSSPQHEQQEEAHVGMDKGLLPGQQQQQQQQCHQENYKHAQVVEERVGGSNEMPMRSMTPRRSSTLSSIHHQSRADAECVCLIVDDNAIMREMLERQVLEMFPKWQVHGVGSGEAAIRLVTESKMVFDLCFVDEAMTCPAMSSTTLTSFATDSDTDEHVIGRMRKSGAVSYIVGCSANNDVENAHVGAGADAFLHKPSSTDIIARTVYTLFVFPPLHSCLFVDDDRIARSLAKRRLKRLAPRCDVQEAASVNEALEMVEKRKRGHPFDVIFLDEHLGAGMRGSEGAKVLRQRQCPSRLVSLSGDTGTVQEAGAPFGLYWSKPWPAAETITSDLFDLLLPTRRAASAQSGRENGGVSAASLRINLGTS